MKSSGKARAATSLATTPRAAMLVAAMLLAAGLELTAIPPRSAAAQTPAQAPAPGETDLERAANRVAAEAAGRAADDVAAEVRRLAEGFQSSSFAERQAAFDAIGQIGLPAIPALTELAQDPRRSLESRKRAAKLASLLRSNLLRREFARLSGLPEEQLSVEDSMFWIAKLIEFDVERGAINSQLDRLAARIQTRLGGKPAAQADPREVLQAMQQVLFVDYGLGGAEGKYYHPHSSSIARVLEDRVGLPILLSHTMIAVGDRLKVPLVGLSAPSRYLVKYDGRRAPPGFPRDDLLVDPYGGGRVLTLEQVQELIPTFDPDVHSKPSPNRAIVARMLRNLESAYLRVGNPARCREVAKYRVRFE